MTFQLRATLAFTDCRPTIDPVSYDPVSPDKVKGDWQRFTRTMKGERTGHFHPYLLKWEEASPTTRRLAEILDDLADTREWFHIQVLPGLWQAVGHSTTPEPTVAEGVLIVLLMEDGWNPDRAPKSVYIDWLNSAMYASDPDALRKGIEKSIESCRSLATRHSIEAYAIDTNTGTRRQLDVDSDAFTEPAPAIA